MRADLTVHRTRMAAVQPWLAHYDSDVPQRLTYPDKTLVDYLTDLARDHGGKPALLFKGAALSYGDLDSQSNAFAAALTALGVRPGDRVALVLPNCPQFFVAEFGAWKAGAIVVPLNPIYTERELEAALTSTGATVVVTLTPFYTRIKSIQARTQVREVIATSIKEYLPAALRILFTLFKEKERRTSNLDCGGRSLVAGRAARASVIAAAGCDRAAVRSGGHPLERRDDGNTERRGRAAPRLHRGRHSVVRVDEVREEAVDRRHHAAAAAVSRLRQRRRAAAGVRGAEPALARAEPA